MTIRAKAGDNEHTPCVMIKKEEPIAFTTEMTPKVDRGIAFPSQQRLQGRTMCSGKDKWKNRR